MDPFQERWCVEFGAWDGRHLSNTFNLIESGWSGIYIEGEPLRYQDLLKTVKDFQRITPIFAYVDRSSDDINSLDKLLSKTSLPIDFDLLSIDIDSYDCDVWHSLTDYSPKIVVIEINSSVPPGIYWRHSPHTPGNTFSATLQLAKIKGYTLICHTGNLIFIRNDLLDKLGIPSLYVDFPELLFNYSTVQIKSFIPGGNILRRFFRKYFL